MGRGYNANRKAREYFGITDKKDLVLHHKDINMKKENPERYYQWNPEDLVVMKRDDHQRYHLGLKNPFSNPSELTKKKMSENHADFSGSNNPRARKVKDLVSGKIFDCIKSACDELNISRSNIYLSIRTKCLLKHSNTKWEYVGG